MSIFTTQEHLTNCTLGECEDCELGMEFYSACDGCGHWMYKDSYPGYFYDQESGQTLCGVCE